MRTKGSAAELEARRRRAAEFFQERKPLAEIARLVGASLSSVKRWKRAWSEGGVAALAAKSHPGPAPKLSSQQKQELVAILRRGPRAAGYRTDLWTCDRVAEIVRKTFRVSYHPDHLGRILHDWADDKIHTLLQRIHAALPAGGGILIAEKLLQEDKTGRLLPTALYARWLRS